MSLTQIMTSAGNAARRGLNKPTDVFFAFGFFPCDFRASPAVKTLYARLSAARGRVWKREMIFPAGREEFTGRGFPERSKPVADSAPEMKPVPEAGLAREEQSSENLDLQPNIHLKKDDQVGDVEIDVLRKRLEILFGRVLNALLVSRIGISPEIRIFERSVERGQAKAERDERLHHWFQLLVHFFDGCRRNRL